MLIVANSCRFSSSSKWQGVRERIFFRGNLRSDVRGIEASNQGCTTRVQVSRLQVCVRRSGSVVALLHIKPGTAETIRGRDTSSSRKTGWQHRFSRENTMDSTAPQLTSNAGL